MVSRTPCRRILRLSFIEKLTGMVKSGQDPQVEHFQKDLHLDKKVTLTDGSYTFDGVPMASVDV